MQYQVCVQIKSQLGFHNSSPLRIKLITNMIIWRSISLFYYEIQNSTHLKRHGPTTVHCELCDYGTYDKVSLKIHVMQNHTFERPFKCDLCEFATTLKLRFVIFRSKCMTPNSRTCQFRHSFLKRTKSLDWISTISECMAIKPKSSNVPNVLTQLTYKKILKSMLSVTQITAPIAVKSVVKLSAEARVSTIFPWLLMIIDQPLVDKVDTLSLVANWMSIKTFIPARNHTNATSVDMQRQLVVICQNIKKKNIQIFKNLITFSNNCIFQNFTLLTVALSFGN